MTVLSTVTKPDGSKIEYLYNNKGRYIGYKNYDTTNILIRSIITKEISPGTYERKEYPKNTATILKFDIQGKLVFHKHEGTSGFLTVYEENTKTSYLDDLVSCL